MTDNDDFEEAKDVGEDRSVAKVGYKHPPVHSRFKPGQSGNPSGRTKGSKNLKSLFNKILAEEVTLREGSSVKTISKAEAVLRGLVIGALKGDSRSLAAMFRLAEATGQFEKPAPVFGAVTRIIVNSGVPRVEDDFPGRSEINKEEPE